MNEEEIKAQNELLAKIKTQNEAQITAAIKATMAGLITTDKFETALKDFGLDKDTIKTLTEAAEKQGLEMKKIGEQRKTETLRSVAKAMAENKDNIAKFNAGESKVLKMTVKTVETVLTDVTSPYEGLQLPGIGQIQRREPFLRELFTQMPAPDPNSQGYIRYSEQTTLTDGSARVAEAGTYPVTSELKWTGRSLQIEKVGDSIKVSKEIVKFAAMLQADTEKFITRNLALKVDSFLLTGTGSSEPFGVKARATAFAAGGFADKYQDANLMDLLRVQKTICKSATVYRPDFALLNDGDFEIHLMGKKDDNNNYVISQNGGMVALIGGLVVITNSGVTANESYVGDFKIGELFMAQNIELEYGFSGTDFDEDLMTLKGNVFFNLLIRAVDAKAFNYCSDITAALVDLNAS